MTALGVLAFLHWNHDWNNFQFDDAQRIRAMKQLREIGVRHIRTDILWSDIDRGPGKFDFSAYDRWIPRLREHGFDPLILLHYNRHPSDAEGKGRWNEPPESFEEFAGYVHATVNRFRSSVQQWEIWNEPNHPVYWSGPADGLATYIRLLRVSREAAKAADPGCTVVNGGLTGDIVKDVSSFYSNGGGTLTDALNLHTFIDPLDPNGRRTFDTILRGVKGVMGSHGDGGKRVWITEMGCPGIPEGMKRENWFQGKPMTEAQQADWLDTQCDWVSEYPFVERLYWAFYRDTNGVFRDATDHFGLVRNDFSPKPSFERLERRIRQGK